MRRHKHMVALGALFVVQLVAVANAQLLSHDTTPAHLAAIAVVLGVTVVVDVAYTRSVMQALSQQELAYEAEVSAMLAPIMLSPCATRQDRKSTRLNSSHT